VDAHVHLHPAFDERTFFGSALRNFVAAARELDAGEDWEAVLVLTEIAGRDAFADLRRRGGGEAGPKGFRVAETGEELSVRVGPIHDERSLTVIGGRQIQTREGLEVLAFPLRDEVRDGLDARSVLDAVADRGASSIIPWGPGKWRLRRGRVLQGLVEARAAGRVRFHMADTGHRPRWAPVPAPLRRPSAAGEATLTGSDPLPLWGESGRAGSCCFEIVVHASGSGPARDLQRALQGGPGELRRFERRPGLASFAFKQAAMQLRKRIRR
jgi:hypothetical protein